MADIYLGFGDDHVIVHHTKSHRSNPPINFDYGPSPTNSFFPLLGVEALGVDRIEVDGRDLSFLLDKEKLAARLHQLGQDQGWFPVVVADGKDYCPEAMMLAERLLGEW